MIKTSDIMSRTLEIEKRKNSFTDSDSNRKAKRRDPRESVNTLRETKFGFPLFVVERDNAQDINQTGVVKDPLRELAGAFWTTRPGTTGEVYYPINTEDSSNFVTFVKNENLSKETIDEQGSLIIEEHYDFLEEDPILVEKIADLSRASDKKRVFTDHCSTFSTFAEEKTIAKDSQTPHLYAKIKSDYNYLQEFYEAASSRFSELSLPNFYAFYESENTFQNPQLKKFLTLDGRIRESSVNGVFYDRGLDSKKNQRIRPVGQYFNKWHLYSSDWANSDSYQSQIIRFQNVIFSHKDVSLFESKNKNKQIFPMFVDIEFATSQGTRASSSLADANVISELQQDVIKSLNNDTIPVLDTFEAQSAPSEADSTSLYNTQVLFGKRKVYDLKEWIDNFTETRRSQIANMIVMSQEDETVKDEQFSFFYNLMSLVTKGKFNKIQQEEARNYSDILSGEQCYNEVVFYKVDKHLGSEQDGDLNIEPIQSFYFSNAEDAKKIAFVDSQVKYEGSYTYKIFAYNLVIGSKYTVDFTEVTQFPLGSLRPTIDVRNGILGSVKVTTTPTMQLMEVEVFQKHVVVMDNPSVAPEVEVIPFRGVEDRIRIFLTSGVGSYDLHPITIEDFEADGIRKLRIAQNIEEQEKVRFESDDPARSFIVYRMEAKPKSYQDFSSSLIREISTGGYASVALDDRIKPNKKYYYCFKSIDIHDHYSYPSFIYEVELVSDSGSTYPLIRTVEFDDSASRQPTKPVKRLIHIKPSVLQTEVDDKMSEIENASSIKKEKAVYLGALDEKVWGKNFKVRLTSKSSGKKVDFNFSFDHEPEKQRR